MIWKTAKFELPGSLDETHTACLAAAERLGWKLKRSKPDKIRLGLPYAAGGMLGKVELTLRYGGGTTALKARASSMDDDLLDEMRLSRSLDRLEETIRLEFDGRPRSI